MNPRNYQIAAVDSTLKAWEENRSALVVMPTGTGKTITFANICARRQHLGRTMVLAHREELINQAADKIHRAVGIKCDIEMAGQRAREDGFTKANVVVSSIQTQIAGSKQPRMARFNPAEFATVIVDEAHHATAASYRKVIKHYTSNPACKVLGVTATPDRADEESLGQAFDSIAYVYELPDAIRDGWLVDINQTEVFVQGLDYSACKITAGDLNQRDIARAQASEKTLHEMLHPIMDITGKRRAIIFASPGSGGEGDDEYHIATRMTEIIGRHTNKVARVAQDTPREERAEMLRRFADGDLQYMVNVGVLTEGFDDPGVEVIGICRPTKSRALYAQMVGRGTRPLPGLVDGLPTPGERVAAIYGSRKPFCEVIDVVGISGTHKLVHCADILGTADSEETLDRAEELLKKEGGSVTEALKRAREQLAREMEEKRLRDLAAVKKRILVQGVTKYITRSNDPFDVLDIHAPQQRGWDVVQTPTPRQVDILTAAGVNMEKIHSRKQASAIIGDIMDRQASGRVGYKMAAALKAAGHTDTHISVGEAMNILFRKAVPA